MGNRSAATSGGMSLPNRTNAAMHRPTPPGTFASAFRTALDRRWQGTGRHWPFQQFGDYRMMAHRLTRAACALLVTFVLPSFASAKTPTTTGMHSASASGLHATGAGMQGIA